MTVTQKQCLLAYLGFLSPDQIDGLWGPISSGATKKLQSRLGLEEDGIWGDATDQAAKKAITEGLPDAEPVNPETSSDTALYAAEYLQEDGYYHIPRGVDVQLSRNLRSHEVMCQGTGCCSESIISKKMVDMFQEIRDDYGEAIEIGGAGGSGFRCPVHNASPTVKGAANSLHLTGSAFDMHARDKQRLRTVAERHITDGEIGVYSWGIHGGVWDRGYVNRFNG